jgi:hypothetical protein
VGYRIILFSDGNAFEQDYRVNEPPTGIQNLAHGLEVFGSEHPSGEIGTTQERPEGRCGCVRICLGHREQKRAEACPHSPPDVSFIESS